MRVFGFFRYILVLFVWLVHAPPAFCVQEYQIKAQFVLNFLQLVQWPGDSTGAKLICTLGSDPFLNEFDKAVSENRIIFRRNISLSDAKGCHLVFISASVGNRRPFVISKLRDLPVLTVSDTSNFAARGGVIELNTEDDYIKLIINYKAAHYANLKISARLLKISKVI
jgi:uncharacterized protein DUF4154